MARFLLISRVGHKCLHTEWIATGGIRHFDVFISAYNEEVVIPDGPCVQVEFRRVRKFTGVSKILQERAATVSTYDYAALFDEVLSGSSQMISKLFDICSVRNLKIAQPALTHNSYSSSAGALRQTGLKLRHSSFVIRHSSFVEMMPPVFSQDILQNMRPLFELVFEFGGDLT